MLRLAESVCLSSLTAVLLLALANPSLAAASGLPDGLRQTNLLFIMFDDMRPDLSIYGREFMITPNFERLAKKSVVFDYAFCQIAVCNPSRDSLLTGLRPDSVGTYNFGHSWVPHLTLPTQLVRSGYNTAGIGKIFHWESPEKEIWSFDAWDNKWYDYQGAEWGWMNASTMPDPKPLNKFRDYEFTSRALQTWEKMLASPKYHMLAVGYKLPHLTLHVPQQFHDLYKGQEHKWKLNKRELRFPLSTSEISYRCCAEPDFKFLNQNGRERFNTSVRIGDINAILPNQMHDELMAGYAAAISFVDSQLGRLLDFMDAKSLWENTTIVLTADHGMHNGEKGIYEKWTLFEEATRVPLLISHPQSPNQGKRYRYPVESIDVYATLNSILSLPKARDSVCEGRKCKALQGKSLAPVLFDAPKGLLDGLKAFFHARPATSSAASASNSSYLPIALEQTYALSQVNRCANLADIPAKVTVHHGGTHTPRRHIWDDCNLDRQDKNKLYLFGYAMRTPEYRYVAYFHFLWDKQMPDISRAPYEEELYDHKNETLADFTHREVFNLAVRGAYNSTVLGLRKKLVEIIRDKIVFGDH